MTLLFLTGIFSCLDRLLRRPLAEVLGTMPIADDIRLALLERQGPYAALLAVAEASESVDQAGWLGWRRRPASIRTWSIAPCSPPPRGPAK